MSEEAVRRLAEAALVADHIHCDTLVLINLYARDAEERGQQLVAYAWNMHVVMLFVYAVTGRVSKQQVDAPAPPEDGEEDTPDIKPQASTALRTISIAIHDVFTRLYEPLRRASGMTSVTRAGIPGNALQEIASHIAAAINTNIQRHFWKRQVQHIRLRQERGLYEGAGDQHRCGCPPPTCAGRFLTGAD